MNRTKLSSVTRPRFFSCLSKDGMVRKLICGLLLLGALPTCHQAIAYDTDGHFYAIYLIARDSGFTAPEATQLAALGEYVDWDPRTEPLKIDGYNQRRLYHFNCSSEPGAAMTRQNSPYAKHNINEALKHNDLVWLGMALHTYLDSYGHEGFGPLVGHVDHLPWIHWPDEPFTNPAKFQKMTDAVYAILKQYRTNNNLSIPRRQLTSDDYYAYATFTPDYWWLSQGPGYEYYNLQPRIERWVENTGITFSNERPVYVPISGTFLTNFFYRIANKWRIPQTQPGCNSIEWAKRTATNSAPAVTALSVASSPAVVATGNHVAARNESLIRQILAMPVKRAALLLVTCAPPVEVVTNAMIQAKLVNTEGFGAFLDSAKACNNTVSLYTILSRYDWGSTDYVGQWEAHLDSKDFKTQMFCASLFAGLWNYRFTNTPSISLATTAKLNAIYQSVANRRLTASDRSYLAQVLPSEPSIIAACAPAVIKIYQGMLQSPEFASQAAAALVRIGESRQYYVITNVPTPQLDAIRLQAISSLQTNKIGLIRYPHIEAEVKYWTIRSYAAFNGRVPTPILDRQYLAHLGDTLRSSEVAGDKETLQAVAIALSTYAPLNAVPESLVTALRSASANPANSDISFDLGYAFKQVTGTP